MAKNIYGTNVVYISYCSVCVCVFKSIQNVYQQQKNHVSEFFVYKISRTEINSLENV